MAFPTFESAPVVSGTDAQFTYGFAEFDLTNVTVTSAKTLLVIWIDPSQTTAGYAGSWDQGTVTWDYNGANEVLTPCGLWSHGGNSWSAARVYKLDNPTPGSNKTIRFVRPTTGSAAQFAYAVFAISESVTQIDYDTLNNSISDASDPYDVTLSGISCAVGDAIISAFSTDDGNPSSGNISCTSATNVLKAQTGSGDSWNLVDYRIASSTSESVTYHVTGSGLGDMGQAIAAIALRNADAGSKPPTLLANITRRKAN